MSVFIVIEYELFIPLNILNIKVYEENLYELQLFTGSVCKGLQKSQDYITNLDEYDLNITKKGVPIEDQRNFHRENRAFI